MIATAANQAGIWAQYTTAYNYYSFPEGSIFNLSSSGGSIYFLGWSVPVTAPNGLVYAFGSFTGFKDLVLVGKPGKPNQATKWYIVHADNTIANRPILINSITAGTGLSVSGKGFDLRPILAPNGLLYLFPDVNAQTTSSLVVFNPNSGFSSGLTTASGQGTISGRILTINSVASGTYGIGQTISFTDPITSNTVTRTIVFTDPGTASFTGTISGTSLSVTAVSSGSLLVGATVSGPGVLPNTTITGGPITGLAGVYTLSVSNSISTPTTMTTASLATTGKGGVGTYRLDSAVPNNVTVATTISGGEFPTCTWEAETFASIAATKFSPAINPTQQSLITTARVRGAVLAKDGYMYTIPGIGGMLMRIAPRFTSVNFTSADRWEMHNYYNGITANFIDVTSPNQVNIKLSNRYYSPRDENGSPLTKGAPYPVENGWAQGAGYNGGPYSRTRPTFLSNINSGILHPNGKIYMFGISRWIFILDPARWNLGDGAIYSKNTLALRTDTLYGQTGFGYRTAMLEKPISEYIAKVTEATSYTSGATVTIKVSDSNYIYPGMTVTVYSGQGSFTNPSSVTVDSVDKINNTFVAKDTTAGNVLQQNFQVNDLIKVSPTQQMLESVRIILAQTRGYGTGVYKNILIDPTTDTLYAYGNDLVVGSIGALGVSSANPTVVPNGLILYDATNTSQSVTHTFTGSDYPITNTNSPKNQRATLSNTAYTKQTSIIPGFFGNPSIFNASGGSSAIAGGTTFGIGESMGKIIYPSSAVQSSNFTKIAGELVSIKGYSAFTRYFNYAPSDKLVYEPPADLYNNLATSLYNSYVNRCY